MQEVGKKSKPECKLGGMFDISKAKREPSGKWDSEAQMPRDMSYKQTAKAVLKRVHNIKWAIWTFIATLMFSLGWTAQLMLGQTMTITITVGLALLTVFRVVSMVYWARAGRTALAAADSHIKIIDNWNEEPKPKAADTSKKNGFSETPVASGEVHAKPPVATA